jgi:hypothetical protein
VHAPEHFADRAPIARRVSGRTASRSRGGRGTLSSLMGTLPITPLPGPCSQRPNWRHTIGRSVALQ